MTMTDNHVQASAPDTGPLLSEFRDVVVPAATEFLENRITASELRERWRPYYFEAFRKYDLAVERSWRQASGSDGRIESGPPTADPHLTVPLSHFPVSIAHNNLDRLIEVLAAELGDQTAACTEIRERNVDFAYMVDGLDKHWGAGASSPGHHPRRGGWRTPPGRVRGFMQSRIPGRAAAPAMSRRQPNSRRELANDCT